ncbi:hypothetical protein [Streptomyces sp. NPDC057287]
MSTCPGSWRSRPRCCIDAPYGVLSGLVADVRARRTDVYDTADRIRSWRI